VSRVLYFDCFSGVAGDMVLGALLDAGLPFESLKQALGSLALDDCEVSVRRVMRAGVSATKFVVQEATGDNGKGGHRHRHLAGIFKLIDASALSPEGRDRAKALFQRLAEAEAAIHDMPIEKVHLHEVGAVDSIIDIVGAVYALDWFHADRIVCSPLNVGGGMVKSAHGTIPVPAPATVKLLGDAPIYSGEVQKELVTPTGALIVSSYATSFGPVPPMRVEQVGYGAGDNDFPSTPNVLRVLIGESVGDVRLKSDATSDASDARVPSGFSRTEPGSRAESAPSRVVVIECEIDDMNPQIFGLLMERLYAAGALEVFYIPVQMKKNRPGTLLTVVALPGLRPALSDIIFRESTTIGLRYSEVDRECLVREHATVETPVGTVRMKLAWREGKLVNAVPEFEDCAKLAAAHNLPVKDVQALAVNAWAAWGRTS
jgi:pyridinium-3,5-bisthiocarboxylic acid mononucleotide nickel chelatase